MLSFPLLLHALLTTSAAASPPNATLLWRTQIGCLHWGPGCWVPGFTGTDSSPAMLGNASIAIGAYGDLMVGSMYRIAMADGSVEWKVARAGGEGSPAVSTTGTVYTSTYGGFLALAADGGKKLWEWKPPDGQQIGSSGALDERLGLIFVGTLGRGFYAINISTGRTVWRYNTSTATSGCTGEVWSTHGPLGVGDSVYFGAGGTADVHTNCSATLHRVDKVTGVMRWKSRTGIQIQGRAGYGALSGHIYIGDYDNCLYAFDSATGRHKWKTCTKGRLEASAAVFGPRPGSEMVVIGSGDGNVYGFDGWKGDVAWKVKLGNAVGILGGGVGSSAALYPRNGGWIASVGGPDAMWGLDAESGVVRWHWRAPSGGMFGSSPLVKYGRLYVGGEDGYLYALQLP